MSKQPTAKKLVYHGDHGPKPRFEGDCWTVYYICGNCRKPVSPEAERCRHCDIVLEGIEDDPMGSR